MSDVKSNVKGKTKNNVESNVKAGNEYEKKFNELISVYEKRLSDMVNQAKSSRQLVSKPLLSENALRINVISTPDGVILFSISKLSQRKGIILTYDDMVAILTWIQQYTIHLKALLSVARRYYTERVYISTEGSILE
jgi:hypothetical protein